MRVKQKYRTYFQVEFTGSASWLSISGACFFWVWMDQAMFGDALLATAPAEWAAVAFFVSVFSSVVALLFFAARPPSFTRKSCFSLNWMVCVGAIGALSSAAIALSASISCMPLLCIGSACLGISMISMNVTWGVVMVAQGIRKVILNTAGAWAAGFVVNALVQCLIPVAQGVAIVSFPLVSVGFYALNVSFQKRKRYCVPFVADAPDKTRLPRNIAKILLVVFTFCLAFGFMYGAAVFPFSEGATADTIETLGMRGVGALVLFASVLVLCRKHFTMLVSAFILFITLGIVLVSMQLVSGGLQDVACLIIALGYVGFDVATWMLIASACTGSTSSNARTVAWIAGAQQAGILVGHMGAAFFEFTHFAPNAMVFLAPLYLFLMASVLLVKMCSDVFGGKKSSQLSSGSAPAAAHGLPVNRELENAIESEEEQQESNPALDAFAQEYGLTKREREMLTFIVVGRSVPYIAQVLVLSENTVKTHIRHVYTKSNVHDRQELLDAIAAKENIVAE